ncbi:hypothetical protein AFCDBAGC_4457 [Methylobacterium cerastii]|uniref:Uncharacterized protein n=1 Tax=Methylobacterium cerastii TaxID=932741 RepID=A0ABQ4QMT4_9HYPH|nr:hypothetical protein [Methylobacterium cerastii]GJD46575.1 hypothetical protein AFCDBAGC_4457 [Methylobacterium cerastii]
MPLDANDREILLDALADPASAWSLGAFGAAAEFRRGQDEPFATLEAGRVGLRTARGGVVLTLIETLRPVAYEMPVGDGWSHAVALCLPATSLVPPARMGFTDFGPDAEALDPTRREAVSFDLGLGLSPASVRIRTDRPAALDRLRAHRGSASIDFDAVIRPELVAGGADLVVAGPLGRIEMLGGAGDASGPRAFVVPKILLRRLTHLATAPIPVGLVPVGHLYPPHPCRDAAGRAMPFERARHDAFQALLARWGDRDGFALKAAILSGGPRPAQAADRWVRAIERVAGAQAGYLAHSR